MKRETIAHLKKCFGYALAQNAGNSQNLASAVLNISDHFFNNHENCGTWCNRKNGFDKQQIVLTDHSLL